MPNHNKLPVLYRRCDCFEKYSSRLSKRGWCQPCEAQFTAVMKRVELIRQRSKLK